MNISRNIIIASHVPIVVTAIYAGRCYKTLGPVLKAFAHFIFFSALIQLASLAIWFCSRNNMPLLHIYVAAGFLWLARFYSLLLHDFIHPKIIGIASLLFFLFSIINVLFFQNIYTFDSNGLTIESVMIIILCLSTFLFLLNSVTGQMNRQYRKSLTWINAGLFIYYASTTLISYFGATITKRLSVELGLYTWIFHSFFSVMMYTFFLTGLWNRSKS